MSCIVKTNQHGYLAYRLYWKNLTSWEGTGLKDSPKNREKMQRKADMISDEIADGTFDYLRWFPTGNKARLFRPAPPRLPERPPTVREYAEQTWLPRKVPRSCARAWRTRTAPTSERTSSRRSGRRC